MDVKEAVYEIGDKACLRVSPLRGVKLFGVKGKLAPRFVGPYRVLEHMGEVTNKLESPGGLSGVHDVFHVSQLKEVPCRDGQYSPVRMLDPGKDNDVPRSGVWTS